MTNVEFESVSTSHWADRRSETVVSSNMGFLSLPIELVCHILFFLTLRDLCCGAIPTCKTFWHAARNCVHIQHKLELHTQGFTETAAFSILDFSRKRSSLNKLVSMWQTDFHVNTVFQEAVDNTPVTTEGRQFMKCGLWWTFGRNDLVVRECNPNRKLSRTWPSHSLSIRPQHTLTSVMIDPLQDLVVAVSKADHVDVHDVGQDHHVFWLHFHKLSSEGPHPDSAYTSSDCKHTFDTPGRHYGVFMKKPAICGDRIYSCPLWQLHRH
ncbi:hypothetical protein EDB19DRAFT_1739907 [Suillus lakei]|nr:hypothetical protein EDB19DRAFT_1739907 [Suillus lakei]